MSAQKKGGRQETGSIRILKNGTVEFTATLEDKDGLPIRKRFMRLPKKKPKENAATG